MNWFMKIFLRHSASAMVLLSSCITPFDIRASFHEQLVVEGMITDQPGPYEVKISKTISVQSQLGAPTGVSGATVVIKDDRGNSETLVEKSSGSYYTNTFKGEVGKTYSISISTSEGNTYESIPEKMLPVGEFGNLSYEFVQNEPPPPAIVDQQRVPPGPGREFVGFFLPDGPGVTSSNGFKIYLDSEVLPEQEDRIRWRWTGTFKIYTFPELQVYVVANPPYNPVLVPDAPPCSGYLVNYPRTLKASLIGPVGGCTCCTCWVTQYNDKPIIADQRFIHEGKINRMNVGFITADRRTFYEKYYLEVEQMSSSKAVYDFWKAVQIQKGNSSNLFQIPPPKTVGNIITTSNATPVIGYFAASSVKRHAIVIPRSAVPYDAGVIDTLRFSCTQAYKNSSTKKPTFW
jgi:hypothetical protein